MGDSLNFDSFFNDNPKSEDEINKEIEDFWDDNRVETCDECGSEIDAQDHCPLCDY